MLCCRKRPPSPNAKQEKSNKAANGKGSKAPSAENQTNGHTEVVKPEAVVLEEQPPKKSPSPQKESPKKKAPSLQKEKSPSPKKEKSPPPKKEKSPPPKKEKSPPPKKEKSPPPKKEKSPPPKKEKSPSPQKEKSPPPKKEKSPPPKKEKSPSPQKEKSKSPTRGSPEKGKQAASSPTKAASGDATRLSEAALADYLRRLETTADVDELLTQGKDLLNEAKQRKAAGGLDAKMSADLTNLITRLEAVTSRLETVANKAGGGASEEELAAAVVEYDDVVGPNLATFCEKAGQIGGVVNDQAQLVKAAFDHQRDLIVKACKAKKPDDKGLQEVLRPLSEKIGEIQDFREKNRSNRDFFNHLSMISESIPALGWVAVSPTPAPHIKDMFEAGQFYSNRVLKDYKEKDKTHVEYVRAFTKTINELQAYVKKTHTTGLTWNKQGVDVSTLGGGSAPPPPPPAGGPPPPPPPPPVQDLLASETPAAGAGADQDQARNQLFASLNKGTDITKSLKKVGDDQKTHKNPNLRLQSPVPYKAASSSPKSVKPVGGAPKPVDKPPKTALEGKKWNIEYHKDNKNIVLDDVNMKQQVYIFRCTGSTIQIKGKVNSIVLDNCKKCAVVFENLVAALEAVNCQSIQAQSMGKVPTISIDKTDGFLLYLNNDSLDAEIVSAKSSEMNILVPQADGEFKEYALPEQYKSTWSGSGFTTSPTDINS